MGQTKDEIEIAEENWGQGGAKCAVCSQTVPLEEKDSYFETGMCGYCHYQWEKDD